MTDVGVPALLCLEWLAEGRVPTLWSLYMKSILASNKSSMLPHSGRQLAL